jgi:cytochrome c
MLVTFVFAAACASGLGSMVHPFGPVKTVVSHAPLFGDAPVPSPVMEIVSRSCQNCHSEKTEWPVYSYIAPASWMVEQDVRDARSHMNLSRWNDYSSGQRQDFLSRIGSLVRNHWMPLPQYVLLHPEARLSDSDVNQIYQWTRSERKRLKAAELPPEPPFTSSVLQTQLPISRPPSENRSSAAPSK